MSICAKNILNFHVGIYPLNSETPKPNNHVLQVMGSCLLFKKAKISGFCKSHIEPPLFTATCTSGEEEEDDRPRPKFKWVKVDGPNLTLTEAQKQAISQLPQKMTNRCKALLKQIICSTYQVQHLSLSDLLSSWVRVMKPRRTDWLSLLKHLKIMDHPLYLQVAQFALLDESFEANVRDYTKVIHCYGKQMQLQEAENTLLAMEKRGFVVDQVTLTAMIHMYSKAGNLKKAEETFEELRLLGHPLDKRAYGSMIMAYIRAGMPDKGVVLLGEMDAQEIYAGSEVYKALLRAYSMIGDADGAQRVFNAIQFAAIPPDANVCGLLINAFLLAGQTQKALVAFANMRRAGLEPNDKCVALVLAAYEKANNLNGALSLLVDLESEGIMIGKQASEILARWFGRLGVAKEVELVLREYVAKDVRCRIHA